MVNLFVFATAQERNGLSPMKATMALPSSKSHTFRVLSQEPEIALFPSIVTTTALTLELCPARENNSLPYSKSHTFRVLSQEPEIAFFPSIVTATALTLRLCPARENNSLPF